MTQQSAIAAIDARLVQIVDRSMVEAVRRGGAHIACKAGCSECCHGPFPISYLDAYRLQTGLREIRKTDPDRASRVIQRAYQTALEFAPAFPGDLASGALDGGDDEIEAFADSFAESPCPALNTESGCCEVYDYRPVPCRTYGPAVRVNGGDIEPCRLCFTNASDAELAAARVEVPLEALAGEIAGVGDTDYQTVIVFALALTPED